ncbi:uncharacterized protein BDR25DRAFT_299534 [Lindgomyces ingoldianus]|uniref:Uncharacterized protein n=1 Tax=Lindgomyces ingoldianus TaxID=673940 RepID=A0ACB6REC8_9PLEO|nr:uncharacterized protein BDR25DRAFT_299534 [Lindgomyces ingoldianus]KAF2477709.1 hypothetical protein BDR25DRAFT_299534 [Lindgomyces ingoldianus]
MEDGSLPVFRAPKRRRFLRKTITEDTNDGFETATPESAAIPPSQTFTEGHHDPVLSVAEIVRARKRPSHRIKNVYVSSTLQKAVHADSAEALVKTDGQRHNSYTDRFVAQTGHVVHDKQMTAYIEARMAEKNALEYGWPTPTTIASSLAPVSTSNTIANNPSSATSPSGTIAVATAKAEDKGSASGQHDARLAAGMGKLQEVDLGPDAVTTNVERTEAALRFARGEAPPPQQETTNRKSRRRRRQEKARNPEDVRRDQLVEQVLREAKLDYYDEEATAEEASGVNQATDEVLAERFRREFLESLESRNPRKPAPPPTQKGAKEQQKPGRKLGGSRSARAAMRSQEEQAAKNKK